MADCYFITDGVFRFGMSVKGTYRNPVIYADVPDCPLRVQESIII